MLLLISLSCFYVQGIEEGLELDQKAPIPDNRGTGRCSIIRGEQRVDPFCDLWSYCIGNLVNMWLSAASPVYFSCKLHFLAQMIYGCVD
jgi:hypothetical protein